MSDSMDESQAPAGTTMQAEQQTRSMSSVSSSSSSMPAFGDGEEMGKLLASVPFQPQQTLPPPPQFGMAGGTGYNSMNFNSLDMDDIFSDVFFTPDGDLLSGMPEDGDVLSYLSNSQGSSQGGSSTMGGSGSGGGGASFGGGGGFGGGGLSGMGGGGGGGISVSTAPHTDAPKGLPYGMVGVSRGITAGLTHSSITSPSSSALYGAGGAGGSSSSGGTVPRSEYEEASPAASAAAADKANKKRPRSTPDVLTKEQKLERRERNREHAKRSRVRKKFLLDSLQKSVTALQDENEALKSSIKQHLGERGKKLVAECECVSGDDLVASSAGQASTILADPDYSLVKALQTAQQNFVITDASLPDNPIVYASQGFLTLSGYTRNQVLGRNCRFLQGPETDPRAVDKIRNAVTKGEDASVCLLNYRSDGTTFWNQFFVAALRDSTGKTVNFVGVQCRVSDDYAKFVVEKQAKEFAASQK